MLHVTKLFPNQDLTMFHAFGLAESSVAPVSLSGLCFLEELSAPFSTSPSLFERWCAIGESCLTQSVTRRKGFGGGNGWI